METTRGRTLDQARAEARVDRVKVETTTKDEMRRHMVEDGLDPDYPLAGFREVLPVASVRAKTGLSQDKFAKALRIPVKTLRNWEQGRSRPDPVALSFFILVNDDPARAFKVLGKSTE